MDRRLDDASTEQLLADPAGAADPAHAEVAALLAQAGRLTPSEPAPALLAAMAAEARSSFDTAPPPRRTRPMLSKTLAARAAVVAAALTLTATGAAAASGTLPDQAQDALASAAERVGFELPRSHDADETADVEAADLTDDDRTTTDTDEVTEVDTADTEDTTDDPAGTADDHGRMVSSIARSDFESGREHGEAVSEAARQKGLSEQGDQVEESGDHGKAPVTTPNHGDAATETGNPAAEQAPVTPNHGAAADETPAADRPAPGGSGTGTDTGTTAARP